MYEFIVISLISIFFLVAIGLIGLIIINSLLVPKPQKRVIYPQLGAQIGRDKTKHFSSDPIIHAGYQMVEMDYGSSSSSNDSGSCDSSSSSDGGSCGGGGGE